MLLPTFWFYPFGFESLVSQGVRGHFFSSTLARHPSPKAPEQELFSTQVSCKEKNHNLKSGISGATLYCLVLPLGLTYRGSLLVSPWVDTDFHPSADGLIEFVLLQHGRSRKNDGRSERAKISRGESEIRKLISLCALPTQLLPYRAHTL